MYNASTVVEWLKAEAHGDKKLADLFERRFLPEFRPAFEAWKKTDPLNNPNAPAGPQLMAEYRSSKTEEAAKLNDQATEVFEQGTRDRQLSDEYVRVTVTLATVLLLMAISQRFKTRGVPVGLLVIAAAPAVLSGLPYPYAAPSIERSCHRPPRCDQTQNAQSIQSAPSWPSEPAWRLLRERHWCGRVRFLTDSGL